MLSLLDSNLIIISLLLVNIVFTVILLYKSRKNNKKESQLDNIEENISKLKGATHEEQVRNREEVNTLFRGFREEMNHQIGFLGDSVLKRFIEVSNMQDRHFNNFFEQINSLTTSNQESVEKIRSLLEKQLAILRDENSKKLEQMRETVDEKLSQTLERRLGDSFKQVSERLELVHKGLGEMQSLAQGVGDLKKVLANVKNRGTMGEVQLGSILEDILSVNQYKKNAIVKKGSRERVDFAIVLPGSQEEKEVLLPLDSKFPLEDYIKLQEAHDEADLSAINKHKKLIEINIKNSAKMIKEKYLNPPATSDFAIMFLPLEGLYAEVLRIPGLFETLQKDYKVVVVGPTTISAFLNSLQIGFRTIAIEQRSSEVWEVLGIIKKEFSKFGVILDKTQRKIQEASNSIEDATRKTRTIEKKLSSVQDMPSCGDKGKLDGEL